MFPHIPLIPHAPPLGPVSYWPELHATWLRTRASLQLPLVDTPTAEQEAWWRYEWVRQDLDDGYGYSDDRRYSYSYSRGRQPQVRVDIY